MTKEGPKLSDFNLAELPRGTMKKRALDNEGNATVHVIVTHEVYLALTRRAMSEKMSRSAWCAQVLEKALEQP